MHMKEAIDKLMSDFNKFLEENAVFKKGWVFLDRFFTFLLSLFSPGKVLRA